MPSYGRDGHRDPGSRRADVVPGSRGGTSAAAAIIDVPDRLARGKGWSVAHDEPYRGGFSTAHYGRPEERQHAVQVELSRRLSMDEAHSPKTEPIPAGAHVLPRPRGSARRSRAIRAEQSPWPLAPPLTFKVGLADAEPTVDSAERASETSFLPRAAQGPVARFRGLARRRRAARARTSLDSSLARAHRDRACW